ncbi:MAG: signal transduction histidine kinase [Oleispira sp.]|jgi:signal transduction histidine kinase
MTNIFKRYFSSVENSISRRLLRTVLSIYFILTLVVTSAHIVSEYYSAKGAVHTMLVASGETFNDILAADMWNYNYIQLGITAESMMRLPFITGIEVTVSEEAKPMFSNYKAQDGKVGDESLFWHEFELNYLDFETLHQIGKVRIYSDTSVVLNQIESGVYTLIINAIIKTIALVVLITVIFNRLLTRPLEKLAHHAESIDTDNPEYTPITVADNPKDELGLLQIAMNRMLKKTIDTIKKLDSLNKNLEKRVMDRTQKLRETVGQLDKEQVALKTEVESRKESELALSKSLTQLKQAQVKLVSSEKMASLGMLAAGIAHEINNPISFVLSNVNVLSEYNEAFHTLIKDYKSYSEAVLLVDDKAKDILGRIQKYEKEEDIEFIIADSLSLLKSTEDGISRVVDIVKNMKTFSHPDADSVHNVDVHEVLDSTLLLLKNEIRSNVRIVKELNAEVSAIQCNRNQLSQIFLNIIMNAVQALADKEGGIVHIRTESDEQSVLIHIIDNGSGIAEDQIKLIFDPFYTTKEVGEGTGMGLAISHGIIEKHNGKISVSSVLGKGTKFTMQFPKS